MLGCISANSECIFNDHYWYVCIFIFLLSFSPFSLYAKWLIFLKYKTLEKNESIDIYNDVHSVIDL